MATAQRTEDDQQQLDRIFRALGDPTRRAMLGTLASGSASVTRLAEPFAMSLPAASKHIRVLETAGLVERSIDGRVHNCSLRPGGLEAAQSWLETQQRFWDETLTSLVDYVDDLNSSASGDAG